MAQPSKPAWITSDAWERLTPAQQGTLDGMAAPPASLPFGLTSRSDGRIGFADSGSAGGGTTAQYSETNPAPHIRSEPLPNGQVRVFPQVVISDPSGLRPDTYKDDPNSQPYITGTVGTGVKPTNPPAPHQSQADVDQLANLREQQIQASLAKLSNPEYIDHLKAQDSLYVADAAKIYDSIRNSDELTPEKKKNLEAQADAAVARAGIAPSTIQKNVSAAALNDAKVQAMKQAAWFKVQPEWDSINQLYLSGSMTKDQADQAKQAVLDTAIKETITGEVPGLYDYQQGQLADNQTKNDITQRGQDITAATTERNQELQDITSNAGNIAQFLSPAGAFADANEYNKATINPSYHPNITGSAANTLYNPYAIAAQNQSQYGPARPALPPQIPGVMTGAQAAAHVAAGANAIQAPAAGGGPPPAPPAY